MLPDIATRYHDGILAEALAACGYAPDTPTENPKGFESHVFAVSEGEILKIIHTLRRSEAELLGELDFLRALARIGLPVAEALPSPRGHWLEVLSEDFRVLRFQRLQGRRLAKADLTPELLAQWGQIVGQMHAFSSTYTPKRSTGAGSTGTSATSTILPAGCPQRKKRHCRAARRSTSACVNVQ